MMAIAIMQPYLFPYIGYWQLINAVDIFVIFDDVSFIKRGYINRNSILVDGKSHLFTLGLIKASQHKLISDIQVGNNRDRILKTIKMAYKKAPYFKAVYPLLEDILNQEEKMLAKFLGNSLEIVSSYLHIDTRFVYSSAIEKDNSLKGQGKILDIAKRLAATTYINSIGGQKLYDKEKFRQENIQLNFIKTKPLEYKQFEKFFVPNLSIVDAMMFNAVEDIQVMINNFELI